MYSHMHLLKVDKIPRLVGFDSACVCACVCVYMLGWGVSRNLMLIFFKHPMVTVKPNRPYKYKKQYFFPQKSYYKTVKLIFWANYDYLIQSHTNLCLIFQTNA